MMKLISKLTVIVVLTIFGGIACAITPTVPGVVVDYFNPANGVYVGGPSIAILPNGDYVACHEEYPGAIQTTILRSTNKGLDWTWVTQLSGQYESTLFVHNDILYIIGGYNNGVGNEYVAIRKSLDGGTTWTAPTSTTTGLITPPAAGYNGSPTPVLVHNGRIWRAFEKVDTNVPAGYSREFRAMVVSAPVDSNLLNASNWIVSNTLLMSDFIPNAGWLEGGVVAAPDGSVKNILRTGWLGKDKAAIVNVSANGSTLSFNSQNVINFPGGCVKFVIRHDPQTNLYWALVNKQTNPTAERNRLVLISSPDLINWTDKATILEDSRSTIVGFQYADWQFEGQDIIFVLRTAFGGSVPYSSTPFHDAEFATFHRIANFRMLDIATTTILGSSEDAPIDQHQNWSGSTKGIPHSNWNWAANELRPLLYGADYYLPGLRQDVLIKWDLSTIATTDIITDITMQMSGWDNPDGVIDVYGIQEGSWAEDTVTWNSWASTPQTLVLLGQLTEAGPAAVAGETIFANAQFKEWVKNWINGSQANNGIILKMSGPNPATGTIGDSFSAKEEAAGTGYGHSPQLVIQHVPASAFSTVTGTVQLEGYTGNLQSAGVQVEFSQNDVVVKTEKTLLDSTGAFSINEVQKGYYDIAIKAFTYLQTVVPNVNVNADPTNLSPVVLKAGDLNGDAEINLLDFAILANSWMSAQ
jgi:hypothetical protein